MTGAVSCVGGRVLWESQENWGRGQPRGASVSLPGPWPVVGLAQLQALPRPSPALTPPVPPLREALTRQRGPGLAGVQLLVPVTAMAVGRGLGRAWAGCSRQGRRLAHAGARGQLQREYDAVVIGGGNAGAGGCCC